MGKHWEFYVIRNAKVLTISILAKLRTLPYTTYYIYQLSHVSAPKCHPQGVNTTKL